jgi:ribosome-binding factor A
MSIRTARVSEEIQKVISERLIRGLRDPLPGFVTVRSVEVTSDFSFAQVFVSVMGSEAQRAEALRVLIQNRGALRYEVGQKVRLRQTPQLSFTLDDSGERAARVHQLLDEIKVQDAERAKPRPAPPAPKPAPKTAPKAAPVLKPAAAKTAIQKPAKKSAKKAPTKVTKKAPTKKPAAKKPVAKKAKPV